MNSNRSRPKVVVDARCLNRPHLRGIGKVVYNLVDRLAGRCEFYLMGDRPDLPFHCPGNGSGHRYIHVESCDQVGYRLNAWQQGAFPFRARQLAKSGRGEVMWCPANSASWWQPLPTVVTVHDLIQWNDRWSESTTRSVAGERLLDASLTRADAMVTISHASAGDIVRRWPKVEPDLRVIANGVDESYFKPTSAVNRPETPYMLYFGGAIPRKRLDWAVKVFDSLRPSNLRLIICGLETTARRDFKASLPACVADRVVVSDFVDESDLPQLIAGATAVLYPTLQEGFGLPVIEAHAVGTAVLHSDVSSLSELIGPASVILDRDDLAGWTGAAQSLVDRGGLAEALTAPAKRWAERFRWDRAADGYYELFEQLAGHSAGAERQNRRTAA